MGEVLEYGISEWLWWPHDCTIGLLIHWPTECQVGGWKAKHEELHYLLHAQGGTFSMSSNPPTVCIRPLILLGLLGHFWRVRPEARIYLQAQRVDESVKQVEILHLWKRIAHQGWEDSGLVLGMLVGWGVHKGHNWALRDFGVWASLAVCARMGVTWLMILTCYSGHPKMEPALFICRIMALKFCSRVAVESLANLLYVIDSYSLWAIFARPIAI